MVIGEEDRVITLTPEESRRAFEAEVEQHLGMDADTFIAKWKAGELNPEDPAVRWIAALLPGVTSLGERG